MKANLLAATMLIGLIGGIIYILPEQAPALLLAGAAALALPVILARLPLTWLTSLFIFAICVSAWIPVSVQLAGLNLRVSQMLLPVVYLRLAVLRPTLTMSRTVLPLMLSGLVMWAGLLFWTLANLGAYVSIVGPLGRVVLLGLNLLHVAAVYLLVTRTQRQHEAVFSLLASVAILNGVLLLATIGDTLGIPLAGGLISEEGAPILVDGEVASGVVSRFTFAGVTAGVVSATVVILAATLLLQPRPAHAPWLWVFATVGAVGMVLGFSRQAVVSLAGGVGVIGLSLFTHGRLGRLMRGALVLPVAVALGFWLVTRVPTGQAFFQGFSGRTAQLLQAEAYETGTVQARTLIWAGMLRDIRQNLLAGSGQDAYLRYMANPDESGSHNFPLEIFHAAGLIGVLAYAFLHIAILAAAWHALRRKARAGADWWLLLGLVGAFVAVWLSSLTNLIYANPVYWAVLGLLLAVTRRVQGFSGSVPPGTSRGDG